MEFFFLDYWYSSCPQPSHQDRCRDYMAPYTESLNSMTVRIKEREDLMGNTVVRQLMTKLICRCVLPCLPQRTRRTRAKGITAFSRA